jgi:hypothetical protein
MNEIISLIKPGSVVTRVGDEENTKCVVIETIICSNNEIYYKLRYYVGSYQYIDVVDASIVKQHSNLKKWFANLLTINRLVGKTNKRK